MQWPHIVFINSFILLNISRHPPTHYYRSLWKIRNFIVYAAIIKIQCLIVLVFETVECISYTLLSCYLANLVYLKRFCITSRKLRPCLRFIGKVIFINFVQFNAKTVMANGYAIIKVRPMGKFNGTESYGEEYLLRDKW